MTPKLSDILIHLKSITGDSIIAWSVNYIIENEELNEATIAMMVWQIKDQIHDNPDMDNTRNRRTRRGSFLNLHRVIFGKGRSKIKR